MAVFLYAFIFVADGKYADYCCYDGNKKWEHYEENKLQFQACCCDVTSCDLQEHYLKDSERITLWKVGASASCSSGSCRANGKSDSDTCGSGSTSCGDISHKSTGGSKGELRAWVSKPVTSARVRAIKAKTATPLRIQKNSRSYSIEQVSSPQSARSRDNFLGGATIFDEENPSTSLFVSIFSDVFGTHSGGNATATAEEADEVMDKFLADAEMELSNPVLITSVGAVFVILFAAIYCFCCKKKRGANDSRSESHGRQHSNKRNATRYTKPRKESRKAHE